MILNMGCGGLNREGLHKLTLACLVHREWHYLELCSFGIYVALLEKVGCRLDFELSYAQAVPHAAPSSILLPGDQDADLTAPSSVTCLSVWYPDFHHDDNGVDGGQPQLNLLPFPRCLGSSVSSQKYKPYLRQKLVPATGYCCDRPGHVSIWRPLDF